MSESCEYYPILRTILHMILQGKHNVSDFVIILIIINYPLWQIQPPKDALGILFREHIFFIFAHRRLRRHWCDRKALSDYSTTKWQLFDGANSI